LNAFVCFLRSSSHWAYKRNLNIEGVYNQLCQNSQTLTKASSSILNGITSIITYAGGSNYEFPYRLHSRWFNITFHSAISLTGYDEELKEQNKFEMPPLLLLFMARRNFVESECQGRTFHSSNYSHPCKWDSNAFGIYHGWRIIQIV
jgi:hypothetical protein